MKRLHFLFVALLAASVSVQAVEVVHVEDPETWSANSLQKYVGKTIQFDVPFYITSNYQYQQGVYMISPRRVYSPTNQALPLSAEYNTIVSLNNTAEVSLTGFSQYHRMGEKIINPTVKVNTATSLTMVGTPEFDGKNSRSYVQNHLPSVDLSEELGFHTLLVCAMNLEYYLVESLGTGYGPDNKTQSDRQHNKIMQALSKINADIYGFVEIEQGQSALKKLAESLTAATGREYSYVDDGGNVSGSYTKSGYVYAVNTVEPFGGLFASNAVVSNRKKLQAFREKSTGESFIFSLNHFKAKSGSGTGANADQGDGQGIFNASRVQEAEAVLSLYNQHKNSLDPDILIMGDLNAYAKEDPIMTLTRGGMFDLHRYFHQDTSYSYVYRTQAGYLDHALANKTMLAQVTGIGIWHINSDEHDGYTYDGRLYDGTMFRCSDHDPVLVGLSLDSEREIVTPTDIVHCEVTMSGIPGRPMISHALNGYYRVYDISGTLYAAGDVTDEEYVLPQSLPMGFYIINVYVENGIRQFKFLIY